MTVVGPPDFSTRIVSWNTARLRDGEGLRQSMRRFYE